MIRSLHRLTPGRPRAARVAATLLAAPLLPAVLATACGRSDREQQASAAERSAPAGQAQTVTPNASAGPIDWKAVDAAMGRTGAMQPGDVHRYSLPRSDLHVTVDGVPLKAALALGSWVAFEPAPGGSVAMGDLVLAEDEVEPVLTRLEQGGVEISALHHHVLRERPRVLYMHVHAMGDAAKIAEAIHAALALTRTPPPAPAAAAGDARLDLDTAAVAGALGRGGQVNGGVYQVNVPRAEAIRDGGVQLPPAMGVATAINFQPAGGGKAAITGDFVLTAPEVNPVIRALRDNGIEVTSLHNHMLTEEPRLFFMHFWATDDAVKLARGLRAALDRAGAKPGA